MVIDKRYMFDASDALDAATYLTGPQSLKAQVDVWDKYFAPDWKDKLQQCERRIQTANHDMRMGVLGLQSEIRTELRRAGKSEEFILHELRENMAMRQVAVGYLYEHMAFEAVIPKDVLLCRKDLVYAILGKLYEYESLWEDGA